MSSPSGVVSGAAIDMPLLAPRTERNVAAFSPRRTAAAAECTRPLAATGGATKPVIIKSS